MTGAPPHVLILAGRRDGDDALARIAGVSHKALVPVAGIPMLVRVAATLRAALPKAEIAIAIDNGPETEAALNRIAAAAGTAPRPVHVPPQASPAATVAFALDRFAAPLLIVTADHPLLTVEMVHHFLDHLPPGVDGAVAVARRETVTARYDSQRTYWRFCDGAFSGCNLFYLDPKGAGRIVSFWQTLERERKKPWKVIARLGPVTLLGFALGLLGLAGILNRLGKRTGTHLGAVEMPFAEAAIDVDRPADLILVEAILQRQTSCD